MSSMIIADGNVLLASDGQQVVSLHIQNDTIQSLGQGQGTGAQHRFDATGLWVLPGIVDIHGDAFERQLQPRPGVDLPVEIALRDTEAQLLANGITTAFHGITLSWEPGLRSLSAWRALLDGLAASSWTCDMRVHMRWEAFNLDALDTALADIETGRVHLLAFNDHTPSILKKIQDPVVGAKYSERAGMTLDDFSQLTARIAARLDQVAPALERLADAARQAGISVASHDDDSIERRDSFRARGARICEFPMSEEVGQAARTAGDFVVMGSPNVVRGGSHLGWASAARLAEAGICNVLSSDYYYPAMMRAALLLSTRGVLDLSQSWALVSANPAAAGGLTDRGTIEPGKRADIVVIDPNSRSIVATIAGGRIAHLTSAGAARLH
jgi:alpha-D-ribose 1-methylphosphonate 5-triphosphate diphosphatase